MRVLWLRPSKGDHISVRRERIAAHLREKGYEIDIVDTTGRDALGATWKAITGDYDVIAGNVRIGLYLGYPLSRLLKIPLLGDVSDPISDIEFLPLPIFRLCERYEWFVLSRAKAAVFVYKSDYKTAVDRGITSAENLPNAVDFDRFANPDVNIVESAKSQLMEIGVNLEAPIAIYIGNLAPHYEIDVILETAPLIDEWEFVFVGEGPLKDHVLEVAASASNVHDIGVVDHEQIPGFLHLAKAGFCFKDAEQPLKIKEYGAAGLPVIVQPGVLEQYYNHEDLVFVEPNPEQIANELKRLESEPNYYRRKAATSREIARDWEWADVANHYDRLFRNMTSMPSPVDSDG